MPERYAVAEVWLWDHRVGAVAEDDQGTVVFEYDPAFARLGLEISPVKLPLSLAGPVTFPDLRRSEAFNGLPGVIADALPDRFGNVVIEAYYAARGRRGAALSPVQRLLYVGGRAMGALEFRPAERLPGRTAEREPLDLADLVLAARQVVEGRTTVAVPEIMRIGSSAGGARPKALVLWNRAAERIRSGFAEPEEGDQPYLIKFDGVGDLGAPDPDPQPYNRIESAYARMARLAGLHLSETHLLEERRLAHFLVKRFDREGEKRLHLHSLGGMHHVDYNVRGGYSYEEYLRTVLFLNLGYEALEEAFRRAVFNVAARNQDDHVKNFAFLMDERGQWRLAPAYDLTYARGQGFTRSHQMTLGGKSDGFARRDLTDLGGAMGIRRDGEEILAAVQEALGKWEEFARESGVPAALIRSIGADFRRI